MRGRAEKVRPPCARQSVVLVRGPAGVDAGGLRLGKNQAWVGGLVVYVARADQESFDHVGARVSESAENEHANSRNATDADSVFDHALASFSSAFHDKSPRQL